jgi:hypothetical protein
VKQNLDPKIAIGVIAVIVLVAAGLLWRSFTAPSAPAHSSEPPTAATAGGGGMGASRTRVEEMRQGHMDR